MCNSAQATSMSHFYCKNSQLAAFKLEALRLLNQVVVDFTLMHIFLAFKVPNIAQIGKGLCLQMPKQSIGSKTYQ